MRNRESVPLFQAVDAELEEMTKAAENLTVATDFSLFQMNAHFANVRFCNILPLMPVPVRIRFRVFHYWKTFL
jgi:hypothetical protein